MSGLSLPASYIRQPAPIEPEDYSQTLLIRSPAIIQSKQKTILLYSSTLPTTSTHCYYLLLQPSQVVTLLSQHSNVEPSPISPRTTYTNKHHHNRSNGFPRYLRLQHGLAKTIATASLPRPTAQPASAASAQACLS